MNEDVLIFLSAMFFLGITTLLTFFIEKRRDKVNEAIKMFSIKQSERSIYNSCYKMLYLPNLNICLIDINIFDKYTVKEELHYRVEYPNAKGKIEIIKDEDLDKKALKLIEDELLRMRKEYKNQQKRLESQQRTEAENKNHDLLINMYRARLDSLMKEQGGE